MTWKTPVMPAAMFVFLISLAAAGDPQLKVSQSAVPDSLSKEIGALLDGPALRIRVDEGMDAEFWLRKDLPLSQSPSSELGVTFGKIEPGTLLGAVRLEAEWRDYKNLTIPAGIYTLRYAVQPADGNHMGVSFYRDFLLLIPAASDTQPEPGWSAEELIAAGKTATGSTHPATLALFPIYEDVAEPTIVRNEMDQWTLAVKLGELTLGMVLSGHGEIEGY